MHQSAVRRSGLGLCLLAIMAVSSQAYAAGEAIFNVKDYGATGNKADDARPAIQKAIDACAAAGGGIVYLPPGQYTSGTLHLRSHVRFRLEAGATLFASPDPKSYDTGGIDSKAALLYAENVENISLEGRGTVDGQAEYDWRDDNIDDAFLRQTKALMKSQGKSIRRPFPKGFPARTIFPHLVWFGGSKDIRITGLSFIASPSWTMAISACERVVVDGIYIYTKLNEAVWADGIDLAGCKDVRIANCTIETGDDCIVFVSFDAWGPALPCENITITNCRLSSSANAIKFSEGNSKGVRNVTVDNCVISDDSSGFAFLVSDGGFISDVVISNITMDLRRFDWYFGQGGPMGFVLKRRSEWAGQPVTKGGGPSPGSIRNVLIRNIIVHAKGGLHISGHPDSWLDGVTLENFKMFVSTDPSAPFDRATHAMEFHWAKNLKLKDIEVYWEEPGSKTWQSALYLEDVQGLELEGFAGRQGWEERDTPAVVLDKVADAVVRDSRALEGTNVFLKVTGQDSRDIVLYRNDLRNAKVPILLDKDLDKKTVREFNEIVTQP